MEKEHSTWKTRYISSEKAKREGSRPSTRKRKARCWGSILVDGAAFLWTVVDGGLNGWQDESAGTKQALATSNRATCLPSHQGMHPIDLSHTCQRPFVHCSLPKINAWSRG